MLFVSHNMAAIQTLCGQALLLNAGRTRGIGDVNSEIEAYLLSRSRSASVCKERRLSPTLTLDSLLLTPEAIVSGASATFVLQLSSIAPVELAEIAILLYSGLGTRIAILDLRTTELDYRFGPGQPLKLRGRIHSLPSSRGRLFRRLIC